MASASSGFRTDIDDTQPLTCLILGTETLDDHVVYLMKVQRGIDSKSAWQIKKRYNEFNELYNQLKQSNYELPMPPKKTFGNMKREFLSTRQIGLQEFMDTVLSNLMLANSLYVKTFLDEENYSQNFSEMAVAHVSMCLRSENWEVQTPLKQIGWRFRKQRIMIKNAEFPSNKYLLTWYEHGPDRVLKESDLKIIFQQLVPLTHAYIEPIVRLSPSENSTIMIQNFNEKIVSLRDYICANSNVTNPYLKKYSLQKNYQTLSQLKIKQIGKKILLALQFLYSKGLFYGHLHTGNVLIEDNGAVVKLTDLPNALLGLPFIYRQYIIEQRKIQNVELVDVYGFGHVLYEMTYGEPLLNAGSKMDFNKCPHPEVKQVLDLLLVEDSLKNGLPTINQLLEMPIFKNTVVDSVGSVLSPQASGQQTASSKLFSSQKSKELLIKARECVERRMNEEQKAVFKLKRQSQVEAKVWSEEEVRKRRKEKKKLEKEFVNNSLEFPSPRSSPLKITISTNSFGSLSSSVKSDSAFSDNSSMPNSPQLSMQTQSPFSNSSISSVKNSNPKGSTSIPSSPIPPPPPPAPSPLLSNNRSSEPPSPPPPPPPPPVSAPPPAPSGDRSQLLSAISSFSKNGLKKAQTNDRSKPKV